jgi:hypothetical protein
MMLDKTEVRTMQDLQKQKNWEDNEKKRLAAEERQKRKEERNRHNTERMRREQREFQYQMGYNWQQAYIPPYHYTPRSRIRHKYTPPERTIFDAVREMDDSQRNQDQIRASEQQPQEQRSAEQYLPPPPPEGETFNWSPAV